MSGGCAIKEAVLQLSMGDVTRAWIRVSVEEKEIKERRWEMFLMPRKEVLVTRLKCCSKWRRRSKIPMSRQRGERVRTELSMRR